MRMRSLSDGVARLRASGSQGGIPVVVFLGACLGGCVYDTAINGKMQDAFIPSFELREETGDRRRRAVFAGVSHYGGSARATLSQDGQPDASLTGDLEGQVFRLGGEKYYCSASGQECGVSVEVAYAHQTFDHTSSATTYGEVVRVPMIGCGAALRPRLSRHVRVVAAARAYASTDLSSSASMMDVSAAVECNVGSRVRFHVGWRELSLSSKDWGEPDESGLLLFFFLPAGFEGGQKIKTTISGPTAGLTIAF